ncbi:hypothetical protein M9979_13180 [Sphingomonas sp. RP10(2022)]|uniref:Uncharacterized protein n=1 Tax=Sphingomonas liriopis TaxID=2949094 RepID=A0A9X2HSP1_9SPHN|nr:hypothetical protein [Sphingomonas liriopis]MCP3735827.1 hypothetical protein [Sphingomonas liriopis]
MASLQEKFPHEIDRATTSLSASEDSWQLYWTLHGPDRRYNSRQLTILPAGHKYQSLCGLPGYISLEKLEEACRAANDKLKLLLSDTDFKDSEVDLPIADGIMVRMGRFKNGVFYSYHCLFGHNAGFNALMSAFAWARERGPVLMKKCHLLST